MEWIIFDADACDMLADLNEGTDYKIRPRLIDNPDSPDAGKRAAPARVLEGVSGEYWHVLLADLPRVTAAPDDLFLPMDD